MVSGQLTIYRDLKRSAADFDWTAVESKVFHSGIVLTKNDLRTLIKYLEFYFRVFQ